MKEEWIVAAVVIVPPVIWWLWEMARAIRENIVARRIMRETRGRGLP